MKNEVLFSYIAIAMGFVEVVDPYFRIVSLSLGIAVAIYAIIDYHKKWRRRAKEDKQTKD